MKVLVYIVGLGASFLFLIVGIRDIAINGYVSMGPITQLVLGSIIFTGYFTFIVYLYKQAYSKNR
jgi:hypothetical protein